MVEEEKCSSGSSSPLRAADRLLSFRFQLQQRATRRSATQRAWIRSSQLTPTVPPQPSSHQELEPQQWSHDSCGMHIQHARLPLRAAAWSIQRAWQRLACISRPQCRGKVHLASASPHSPHILFLLGGPGAGKGTQSQLLVSEFGADVRGQGDGTVVEADVKQRVESRWPRRSPAAAGERRRVGLVHVSVGALLRAELLRENSVYAAAIVSAMQTGAILPGEVSVALLAAEMQRALTEQRSVDAAVTPAFIVDGFPRSMDNVEQFQALLGPLRCLLYLRCSDSVLLQRLQRRALLSGRPDDVQAVIHARLTGFHQQTVPVLDWWRRRCEAQEAAGGRKHESAVRGERLPRLWDVDGEQSIEAVYADVRRVYADFVAQCCDDTKPG